MHIYITRRKCKGILFSCFLFVILVYFGAFHHIFEKDFNNDFHYPYDGDIEESVQQLRNNMTPAITPINSYNFRFHKKCVEKCQHVTALRLVYLVKSAPENFQRRLAIRSTWGYEHRFSDVELRTVFLVGYKNNSKVLTNLNKESHKFQDIVQANFTDYYFNNTFKTMMGFSWALKYCSNARFYMFVDDDYYVSTKNVLRFIRNPTNYPNYLLKSTPRRYLQQLSFDLDESVRLYTGFGFKSAPHRHMSSKWYVSLDEYPYHMWPPYITAGAYILSREALLDMYFTSFYTKHFKFDDIYVGLLAYKSKIEPFHSNQFHFYKLFYNPIEYKFVVASHGYGDTDELLRVWTEQRSLGNA